MTGRTIYAVLIVLLAPSLPAWSSPLQGVAPQILLQDQHGREFRLDAHRGEVVVLIGADKTASDQSRAWGKAVMERFGSMVTVIGIADTRGVPFFLKRAVRSSFEQDRVRVLTDWEGRTFEQYGFVPGTANVVIIDRAGRVRFVHAGSPEREPLGLLFDILAATIAETVSSAPD